MPTIIAYVPGISGRSDNWKPLIDKLRAEPELRNAQWLPIDHHTRWISPARFDSFAANVKARIGAEMIRRPEIDQIILVGHSYGGQLVRKAFMLAASSGEMDRRSPLRWDTRVKRFVLFASANRGINPKTSSRVRLGLLIMRCLYPIFGRTVIFDLLPGSKAVVTLRLAWIRYFATLPNPPLVVGRVLGSSDTEVARGDLPDTEQFSNAYHIDVPDADHIHLYNLNSTPNPALHYDLIRRAFVDSVPLGAPRLPKTGVSGVIFLLHGIRATAHQWPRKLEQVIKANDPNALVVRPSTGYFTAFRFAVPLLHRRALRWFQDQYGQLVAKYPNVQINFVGHSNGTYLMGQSLSRIDSIKFDRVFLGGCVLPQDYPWPDRFSASQVQTVVNAFTETDGVVGGSATPYADSVAKTSAPLATTHSPPS